MLKARELFVVVVTFTPSSRPVPNLELRQRFVEVVYCWISPDIIAAMPVPLNKRILMISFI